MSGAPNQINSPSPTSAYSQTETSVSVWRCNALRIIYFLIFAAQSSFVWQQLFFESSDWPAMTGVAKSMMAAMALLCLLGMRYPLQMLPLLLWETLWKSIWILVIALPAFGSNQWPELETTFYETIGIVILYFILPWNYIWSRFFRQVTEPWK